MPIFTHCRPDNASPFIRQEGGTHAGRVLGQSHTTVHVPSDNAMIDSGDRYHATVWEGGRVVILFLSGGYDCFTFRSAEIDAPDDVIMKASEYNELTRWIKSLKSAVHAYDKAAREGRQVTKGKRVTVVKGRKVKPGTTWYVYAADTNGFGSYVHLSQGQAGLGECVKYVSPSNLKVIGEEPSLTFPPSPWGPVSGDVIAVALKLSVVGEVERDSLWNVLRDAWEDSGLPVPAALTRAALWQD